MDIKLTMEAGEFLPLREVVFKTLRKAILTGQLQPGERLMEIQLAEKLGVSRTPVREAIRKLEIEGLAVMVPRKGAEVARITSKQLKDVLEVRKALEQLAVSLACEKITEEEIEQLMKANENVQKMVEEKNLTEIVRADMLFHEIIYKAADNEKLLMILYNLKQQMYRFRLEYLKNSDTHERIVAEHAGIVEALKAGQGDIAARAICDHIDNQENGVISLIEEQE